MITNGEILPQLKQPECQNERDARGSCLSAETRKDGPEVYEQSQRPVICGIDCTGAGPGLYLVSHIVYFPGSIFHSSESWSHMFYRGTIERHLDRAGWTDLGENDRREPAKPHKGLPKAFCERVEKTRCRAADARSPGVSKQYTSLGNRMRSRLDFRR